MPAPREKRVLVEVCVGLPSDANAAAEPGADRIELNAALEVGGLTPSLGSLLQAREQISIPIIAMIRPRPGGFCYDRSEFDLMRRDAELMARYGADGIAAGILTPDRKVDLGRCRELIQHVAALGSATLREGIVFHRAFDFVDEPFEALEQLIELGVRRVMTSGGAPSAREGADRISDLIRRAEGRIEILPAGGIRAENVADLVARTGCDQVHASVRERRLDPSLPRNSSVSLGDLGNSHFCMNGEMLRSLIRATRRS